MRTLFSKIHHENSLLLHNKSIRGNNSFANHGQPRMNKTTTANIESVGTKAAPSLNIPRRQLTNQSRVIRGISCATGAGWEQRILKVRHDERTYLIRTACTANLRRAFTPASDYTRLSKMIESRACLSYNRSRSAGVRPPRGETGRMLKKSRRSNRDKAKVWRINQSLRTGSSEFCQAT